MFRAYPAHIQEVYVVIVCMQSLVSSLSAGDCPVHRLRKNWSDEQGYIRCQVGCLFVLWHLGLLPFILMLI